MSPLSTLAFRESLRKVGQEQAGPNHIRVDQNEYSAGQGKCR